MNRETLSAAWHRWLFRVSSPEPGPIELGQRRIFVLPSRFGLALGATLAVMLLASINYNLSLGYALTFLIGGIGWMSIHHAFRNLVGLRIEAGRAEPVFCGEAARFGVIIGNPGLRPRHALNLRPTRPSGKITTALFDIPAEDRALRHVNVQTTTRGWLPLPRLTLETYHPLGLIRAWSLFQPDERCLVYPAPELQGPPLPAYGNGGHGGGVSGQGRDDFSGLRHHQPADSPRHIAWRAVARGGPWRTKEFSGSASSDLILDWTRLPADLSTEGKLARLTRWVLEADRAGILYALHLPARYVSPSRGREHLHACLTALALHEFGDA